MSDFEDLQKTCECITEVFNQLTGALNEIITVFREIFGAVEEERRKLKSTSPRVYGMSLVHNLSSKTFVKSYNYIPSIRRNLPYQRRRF